MKPVLSTGKASGQSQSFEGRNGKSRVDIGKKIVASPWQQNE